MLCESLLRPIGTHGGSFIDELIEQEILEVLRDARAHERCLYEVLRYEFS